MGSFKIIQLGFVIGIHALIHHIMCEKPIFFENKDSWMQKRSQKYQLLLRRQAHQKIDFWFSWFSRRHNFNWHEFTYTKHNLLSCMWRMFYFCVFYFWFFAEWNKFNHIFCCNNFICFCTFFVFDTNKHFFGVGLGKPKYRYPIVLVTLSTGR